MKKWAWIGVLILAITLTGCMNSNKREVEKLREELVEKERQLAEKAEMDALLERKYADAVTNVVTFDAPLYNMYKSDLGLMTRKMRDIDLTQCPKDFQLAYLDHIHAWEDMAKVQAAYRKLSEQADLAVVAGLIATLTESKASPFSNHLEAEAELDRLGRNADKEIADTWQALERLVISYGGQLPK